MDTKECRRYKVSINYEAKLVVDVDIDKNKELTSDEIFTLARWKALTVNDSEFRIGDEVNQDILSSSIVPNGKPMDDVLEFIKQNSMEGLNDNNNGEEEAEHNEDLVEGDFD